MKVPCCSLVAKNRENEVVGISLNTIYKYDDLPQSTQNATVEDYKLLIDEGPYENRNANRLAVFIDGAEEGLFKFVSPWAKIFKLDILAVRSDQAGKGLGSYLLKSALELAVRHQCTHVATCATAQASQRLFIKKSFLTVKETFFEDFKDNGDPIYTKVPDHGKSAKLMLLPLQ
ncbi:unnamed protein product [Bursaphelenchus okinawaensis]|uniref:N-acetyltransferase domain-containing protein n=1 Tax=Bursaphelenchus okinawaensis TaxID=465554 RepID=A0A811L9U4_9BILA|nr:unnamed protein product [Bursaphelenchus okinawaensis]CAG9120446.1 unnamed protein product [Bursaphelenchus okinawaensis]